MGMLSAVTTLNVTISLAFALLGVWRPEAILPAGMAVGGAATTFALYAAVRSLALAAFVAVALLRRDASALRVLAALAAVVQLLDAGVGINQGDISKIVGPAVVAALQTWALGNGRHAV